MRRATIKTASSHQFRALATLMAALVGSLAVLLWVGVSAEPAQAAFPGLNGKIVFQSFRDGHQNYEIYAMKADGTGQTNLTNNSASDDHDPAVSPDGTKIAFTSGQPGGQGIRAINVDGTGQTSLTNNSTGVGDWYPAYSPDGTKIAFTRWTGNNNDVYVMNADGTGQANLTQNASYDYSPDWGPVAPPVITAPENNSYDTDGNVTISGTTEADSIIEVFDGSTSEGKTDADGSGNWTKTLSGEAEGPHTYTAKVTDASGSTYSRASNARSVIVDTIAPTVSSVSPAAKAILVDRATNVTATFSEAMKASTLSTTTVTLKNAKTKAAVAVSVSCDDPCRTITVNPFPSNPRTKLAKNTKYEVRITTGAQDLAGNALAADKVWTFTTGAW